MYKHLSDEQCRAGLWKVAGPVKHGTLNVVTGEMETTGKVDWQVRAIEPKMFGGTVIAEGLTEEQAFQMVRAHNDLLSDPALGG